MQSPIIKFGTDGWRGRIADTYTFDSVRRCAYGFAQYMLQIKGTGETIIVGYDRRFASENFASAVAEVLAANNFKVLLTEGPTPTPAISYSVVANRAAAAVNITASHNPPLDNGFKVRNEHGGAIDPDGLRQIEALIPSDSTQIKSIPLEKLLSEGKVEIFDPAPAYLSQINHLINLKPLRSAGLNVMVDPMWGNGAGWFNRIFSGSKTKITEIHDQRNPIFPEMERPEPIPPNINPGLTASVENNSDVLIIFDGDADRVGLGDEHGQFVDQLRVFGLLAYYLLEVRGERGPIVKTLSTTTMLNKLGHIYNVPVYETGVGFKYVAPKMLEVDALIGGEESGGYAFRHHVPERDGIIAALYLLDMMVQLELKPSQLVEKLFEKVGAHYYDRIDTHLPPGKRSGYESNILSAAPKTVGGLKVIDIITIDGYKFQLEDGGWLLIRFSGTEPIVRVYCESTDPERVGPILEDGLKIIGIQ
ncbi:MAG: phosphomannomutase [Chloroflexi bacterium RBG_16_48_8]|nr:MAG: phosphomannomutase [Chloroflexi bacterium RBG_16_48_8]